MQGIEFCSCRTEGARRYAAACSTACLRIVALRLTTTGYKRGAWCDMRMPFHGQRAEHHASIVVSTAQGSECKRCEASPSLRPGRGARSINVFPS